MSASTDATPIIEDYEDQDVEGSETESDDEEAQLLLLGDTAGAERARLRKEQRTKRRQLRAIREKEKNRQKQMVEAINLEMKFGCTGIIPKEKRKKDEGKERSVARMLRRSRKLGRNERRATSSPGRKRRATEHS